MHNHDVESGCARVYGIEEVDYLYGIASGLYICIRTASDNLGGVADGVAIAVDWLVQDVDIDIVCCAYTASGGKEGRVPLQRNERSGTVGDDDLLEVILVRTVIKVVGHSTEKYGWIGIWIERGVARECQAWEEIIVSVSCVEISLE